MTYCAPFARLFMVFVETPHFSELLTAAMSDSDYALLQYFLAERPDAGQLIVGGGGIRKVRWSARGKGRRGGFRVIYYWRVTGDVIFLLDLFSKNEKSDLTRADVRQLAQAAKRLK